MISNTRAFIERLNFCLAMHLLCAQGFRQASKNARAHIFCLPLGVYQAHIGRTEINRMPKAGNTAINISLPDNLAVEVKRYFAPLGKGALSERIEKDLITFLLRKKVRLPEELLLKRNGTA